MILKEKLLGDWKPQAKAFGRAQLRRLELLFGNTGPVTQQWADVFGDFVRVQHDPPFQRLWVIGSSAAYFEFFTSGNPVFTDMVTADGFEFDAYKIATVGVNLRLRDNAIVTEPSVTTRAPADENASSLVGRISQVNLYDEPVGYPRLVANKYPRALYESWAPGHSHTGMMLSAANNDGDWQPGAIFPVGIASFWRDRGSYTSHTLRDVGTDIPFEYGDGRAQVKIAYLQGEADWPRANAMQTVTHSTFGTRQFAVCVDAFNQVSVFPVSSIETVNHLQQNVPEMVVKMVSGFLPAWVVQPTERFETFVPASGYVELLLNQPDLDWKFKADGTAAVAIVYERTTAVFDAAYFIANPGTLNGATNPLERGGQTGLSSRIGGNTLGVTPNAPTYLYGTGIVRLNVAIALTGANPEDFTLDVTCDEIRRPTTSTFCSFMAGYAWQDIKAPTWTESAPVYLARIGDLLALDIERWYEADPVAVDPSWALSMIPIAGPHRFATGDVRSFFSLKANGVEVKAFPGATLLACDLRTGSMVVGLRHDETITRTLNRSPSVDPGLGLPATLEQSYAITHPAAAVFTQCVLREVLFPDTIDTTNRAELQTQAESNPRTAASSGYTLLELNDLRDWTAPGLTHLRNYICRDNFFNGGATTSPAYSDPILAATLNWWVHGMRPQSNNAFLTWLTNPSFGWAGYMHEITNRLMLSPHTTFFSHPNGTWAFFDQQHIYNKHGIPEVFRKASLEVAILSTPGIAVFAQHAGVHLDLVESAYGLPWSGYDTLSAVTTEDFEHVIYDRVHFVMGTATKDTSLGDLYNAAIAGRDTQENELANFLPLPKTALRATLTRGTVGNLVKNLRLRVDWKGRSWYLYETIYHKGNFSARSKNGTSAFATLASPFYTEPLTDVFDTTKIESAPIQAPGFAFSSCLALGL